MGFAMPINIAWPRYTIFEYGPCLGVMVDSLVVA